MTQLSPNILLRCTILDSMGTIKTISGLFKKMELCSHHGLEPRDLRKIDSRVPNLVPTILARRSGILINILHIRAMIKSDAVLLFDSYGTTDTRLHSAFVYNLEHNLRQNMSSLPYEFRALESILASVLDALRTELGWLKIVVDDLLEALEDDIDREKLRMLLQVSRKISGFLSRSRGVKSAVTEVLENDEDMALMYLTDAKNGYPKTEHGNLEELELLLESFEKQVEEVLAEVEQINSNVNNTQEIVELILDSTYDFHLHRQPQSPFDVGLGHQYRDAWHVDCHTVCRPFWHELDIAFGRAPAGFLHYERCRVRDGIGRHRGWSASSFQASPHWPFRGRNRSRRIWCEQYTQT